jgi:cysteinyl-tRNA synthetase
MASTRAILRVRNSLTGRIEPFPTPRGGGGSRHVTWYTCGPTVYDDAHVGHARAFVCTDILRRVATRVAGIPVHFAMGLTDVDDKIIARARETSRDPTALAAEYEARFMEDTVSLGIEPPHQLLRVTEHVEDIVAFASVLADDGRAYATASGLYFDTERFGGPAAMKLHPDAGTAAANGKEGSNHEPVGTTTTTTQTTTPPPPTNIVGAETKRSPRDFALWRNVVPGDTTSLAWDSPWGRGRPGWHIECSTMAIGALGRELDVHSGGIDLRFPHHCNEIAQSESFLAATTASSSCQPASPGATCPSPPRPWGSFFWHVGHVTAGGRKMSKSLKNFVTVRDLAAQGRDPMLLRWASAITHYADRIEYSEGLLDEAASAEADLVEVAELADAIITRSDGRGTNEGVGGGANGGVGSAGRPRARDHAPTVALALDTTSQFREALLNDLDTPAAMKTLRAACPQFKAALRR